MSSTSCPTGSGAAPWVFWPRSRSPRPDRAPGPPMCTTRCHTLCSRPRGSVPPPAPRRSRCPPSGARSGALQRWDGGSRVRSGSFGPQTPPTWTRGCQHPTANWSPGPPCSPSHMCTPLSASSALAAAPYIPATQRAVRGPAAPASPAASLGTQNPKPCPGPTESESVFNKTPHDGAALAAPEPHGLIWTASSPLEGLPALLRLR